MHSTQRKFLVSTGLMHVLATNLCVWFRFLVKEVEEGIYTISYSTSTSTYTNAYKALPNSTTEQYDSGTASGMCTTSSTSAYNYFSSIFILFNN